MVEAIIAVSVFTIGIVAILSLLSRSTALSQEAGNKFIAAHLAAEGAEIVKNIVDENFAKKNPWNKNVSNGTYEVSYDNRSLLPNQGRFLNFSKGFFSYSAGTSTIFKREVTVQTVSQSEVRINAIVRWTARGRSQQVNVEDHFYNWRP